MLNGFLKNKISLIAKNGFKKKSSEYQIDDLKKSTFVIAPHFDDETLGCGGMIYQKITVGADVKIIFMTDGTQSHSANSSTDELKNKRTNEAFNACGKLGVSKNDIIVLGFCDTQLDKNLTEASENISNLIKEHSPEEIFIPSEKEPWIFSGDHLATTKIVNDALQGYNKKVTVYEYPVWYWYSWPWVSLPVKAKKTSVRIFKNSLTGNFGLGLKNHFNCYLKLDGVKEIKYEALEQHESQMKPQNGNDTWNTLGGVSDGEFLKCFFDECEFYNKRVLNS